MNYEDFEFLYGFNKEDIKKIMSMEGGKEFLDAYIKRAQADNGMTPINIYNAALDKSLAKSKTPIQKKKKMSEETRVKILASIALIIVLLGCLHRDPDWKKGDGKASTSYSDVEEEAISHKGRG